MTHTGTLVRFAIVLSIVVLSGCSLLEKNAPVPCGVTDYIATEAGSVVTGVALPTDEVGKTYNIVTPKAGFWMSLDCDNRRG